MLNLSKIQSELERAKEKLRNVEETIQKVEGKTFSNGPVRYGGPKNDYHSDKLRNPTGPEDVKNQRRRIIASTVDSRIQRLPVDDTPFSLKRGLREKRESGLGLKRQLGDSRPQGVFARLSGAPFHQADEEDEDDFGKKPTLPSRVFTTATEVPSRQEVIAAQAQDEQSKERNKRMFGALVGTLQKFRKEETRVREREEKRMKVERKLEENAKREKEKLMQEKRELFLEKKRREVEIKRIEWSLNRVKEYEAWEANVLPLKNFIQTQAKPHIFYLPSTHNAKTEERLAHSQKLVERMIEKRKTNLKEEIENSEKKARKAAAEEAEEEEAENIPEENEESCNTEQQVQLDFEHKNNKENGYFEEVKNDQPNNSEGTNGEKETDKTIEEENWEAIQEHKEVEQPEVTKHKVFDSSSKEDTKNSPADAKGSRDVPRSLSPSGEALDSGGCEEPLKSSREGGERNTEGREMGERKDKKSESGNMDTEMCVDESLDTNPDEKTPPGESEGVKDETNSDAVNSNEENLEKNSKETADKKPFSESELNIEDSLQKKLDSPDNKNKTSESSKTDKSPGTRSRRSRSPKKSRSPKNSSRDSRRKSDSRQRRVSRRSSSGSPPKKSRRSRSPISRRGEKNFGSRKRSPQSKTRRRRRSSSRSSSSGSIKKKRSRTSSRSSSNSD